MILSTEHFNLRGVSTALASVSVSFISFVFSEAYAGFELSCASVFQLNSEKSQEPELQNHTQQQVHQFVRLLIDSQSEQLSQSERQSRLADAQRVFLELTSARPEIADQILKEWRNRFGGSPVALEARRAKLTSDIRTLEEQIRMLSGQLAQMAGSELIQDSHSDPTVTSELRALLETETGNQKVSSSLYVRDKRYVATPFTAGASEFDAQTVEDGHSGSVEGAQLLSDGRVFTWSIDYSVILWKLENGVFVVDQRLVEPDSSDFAKSHFNTNPNGAELLSDGRLATWSGDHTIILWKKLMDGKFVIDQRLGGFHNRDPEKGHTSSVFGFRELPDGRLLSWSFDQFLIVWKFESGRFVFQQRLGDPIGRDRTKGHTSMIFGARELSNGRILSWSFDRSLIIWRENKDGKFVIEQRLSDVDNTDPSKGHTQAVMRATELADGSIISKDSIERFLLWRVYYPDPLNREIKNLSQNLNFLKEKLLQLEAELFPRALSETPSQTHTRAYP